MGMCFLGNAQERLSKDSLDYYLSTLDNTSITIAYNHFDKLGIDEKARRICQNASEEVVQYLIKNLSNSKRTVICHVILTRNLVLHKPGFRYEYNYSGQKIVWTKYVYNNLSWIVHEDGRIEVSPNEVSKIKKYWSTRKVEGMLMLHNCTND